MGSPPVQGGVHSSKNPHSSFSQSQSKWQQMDARSREQRVYAVHVLYEISYSTSFQFCVELLGNSPPQDPPLNTIANLMLETLQSVA